MQRKIDSVRDHYIVCTYGRVGRTVAHEFESEGVAYVVIEPSAELEEDLQRDGVLYLHGNPSSEEVLRRAGVDRARGLVCAADSDAENVFVTLVARSLQPADRYRRPGRGGCFGAGGRPRWRRTAFTPLPRSVAYHACHYRPRLRRGGCGKGQLGQFPAGGKGLPGDCCPHIGDAGRGHGQAGDAQACQH
jgi:TrkA family protein